MRDLIGAHRRAVGLCVLLLLGLALWLRLVTFVERVNGQADYGSLIRSSLDSLLSTIAVSAAIGTFFWWVRASDRARFGELFPDRIASQLERAAQEADEWDYVGHTARYVRARILPILGARTSRVGKRIALNLVIIDPTNPKACQEYAAYRNTSRSASIVPDPWTAKRVQTELLATMICLIRAKARFPDLGITLGFAPSFGLWRFDRSNRMVMMTQEDPQQPAYYYEEGTRFFAYHSRECALALQFARTVSITKPPKETLSRQDVDGILKTLLGEASWNHLAPLRTDAHRMAENPVSPYA
ncbi:hypothetical protein [Novosphingobium sp.]|uniref:hypothetical protein n=1 Tax=Novosphingobium sp. TaxID=1874826 RepID=UPI0026137697|nr:hypothetical protein [Novosphingobium sp.]